MVSFMTAFYACPSLLTRQVTTDFRPKALPDPIERPHTDNEVAKTKLPFDIIMGTAFCDPRFCLHLVCQQFCRLMVGPKQVLNPDWLITFIQAHRATFPLKKSMHPK